MNVAPAISAILILLSGGGILLETAYRSNPQAERLFCRLNICATNRLVESARSRWLEPGAEAAALAVSESLLALGRDPASAARWIDAGESLRLAGQQQRAKFAFDRAVALAPNSPPVLLEAASFYFRKGEPAAALPLTARILHLIRDYDSVIFLTWSRSGAPLSELLRIGLPADPEAARSFFRFTLSSDSVESAAAIWQYLRSHGYDTPALAAGYLDYLLARRLYADADNFWRSYAPPAGRSGGNLLFNGDFEADFSGARFDWVRSASSHATERRDSTAAHSGAWSLRVDFDGAENLEYRGAAQTAVATPGRYCFRAWLKLQNLTTDRGVYFRIFDAESPARLDVHTEALTGSAGWTPLDLSFDISPGTNLLKIQICRDPSWKFDNKLAGVVFVDSVELRRFF